ncbi:hypothetical protein CC80DRAFT_551026 [Byssothecium circinans]|uniref:Uncharacterized protein n=1 Tax=Byssothecium circinans TaxID=147558 RepID=A0A6A5TP33_9PLEO|nr:hypothetical protein CC80DRAFT_551026 [Byssothecium circinans]
MAAKTTKVPTGQKQLQNAKPETSKQWLARQLRKPVPVPWQSRSTGDKLDTPTQTSLNSSRIVSSSGTAVQVTVPPVPPSRPLPTERPPTQHEHKVPPQSARAESGVVRNVNAWLDASSKPDSPLMSGLPYWRKGQSTGREELLHGQYAVPIVREPEGRNSTSSNRPLKSFCRRAKKMQVRMPSLKRTHSQWTPMPKQICRRSTSTPLLAMSYEDVQEGTRPAMITRSGSIRKPLSRPYTANAARPPMFCGQIGGGLDPMLPISLQHSTPASASTRGPEYHMERQADAGYTLRPVPSTSHIQREDSMGSLQLSEAPTYFTGPPPPSYRSRAASILTTSSFGCIDGMNPEQRQRSQQRAQRQRGMKGKLKKFAQKAIFTQ